MLDAYSFANPEFLWLLLALPLLFGWLWWSHKQQAAVLKISSLKGFSYTSLTVRLQPILWLLRTAAIAFFIIALARPQKVDVSFRTKTSKGIDILMAIDISSSMLARDLKPNRLEALKKVASEFVENRINDRVGLVVYAGESYTKTPITSDKNIVVNAIREINFEGVINDGTAIGMGLATSVNRLKDSKAISKVIILLTDGVNNSGFINPITAAELAQNFEIKTYTIGLGSNGNALAPVGINQSGQFQYGMTKVEIDEALLKEIAQKTGGKYFRATNNKKLEEIYEEINKLEKSDVEEFRYTNYDEKFRFFALIAGLLMIIEWLLRSTLFKSFV